MNFRPTPQPVEQASSASTEMVLSADRVTDAIGHSLRRVFDVETEPDERWATLLRRLR